MNIKERKKERKKERNPKLFIFDSAAIVTCLRPSLRHPREKEERKGNPTNETPKASESLEK